jgi:hypothetical protein
MRVPLEGRDFGAMHTNLRNAGFAVECDKNTTHGVLKTFQTPYIVSPMFTFLGQCVGFLSGCDPLDT